MRFLKQIFLMLLFSIFLSACNGEAPAISSGTEKAVETAMNTVQETNKGVENTMPIFIDAIVKGEKQSMGTWWWNAGKIRNKPEMEKRLEFLQKNNITEIYLYYGGEVEDEDYRSFISRCSSLGIRVAALAGDAVWVLEEKRDSYEKLLENVLKYQEAAAEDEKFYGLHLDVEPQQLEQWHVDPKPLLPGFAYIVDSTAEFCRENRMLCEFDITMWLDDDELNVKDGEETVTLGEYITRRIDTISIMSYRDTAARQYADSMREMSLAKKYGKKVILGSETGKSTEAEFVSYYEEGTGIMNSQLKKLKSLMLESFGYENFGFAIHHVQSWMELKD